MKSATGFRRSILVEIKARPVLWDPASQAQATSNDTDLAWKDIQTTLGIPNRKLKSTWWFFCSHYYRILMTKAMERNDDAVKWKHFHDMTFMYELVTEKIRQKMGGISPPLLKPSPAEDRAPCPCCQPAPALPSSSLGSPESHPIPQKKRRSQPLYVSGKGMHAIERERIIEAIKAHPILYDREASSCVPQGVTWRKVAKEVGIPLYTIQNRWRQYKHRYLDELMKERSCKGPFRPSWQNFEQMSFMRKLMRDDIDQLERVREEMTQLVQQKKSITDSESDGDLRSWMHDSGQREVGVVTLDLPSEEDVIFLSDDEESAGSYVSENLPKSPAEEVICIDSDDESE